ncbi:hypothetical protein FHT32_000820 [Variovorax sp. SG517]|uniref:hypothetical protein n=1 Tax=Variovorax sp. SG517 TaxID=2587117 RepID=UPI00159D3A02|nr:hypothetical protein [Variovorax sp. SG517]NVM87197.1 hypothetical protein [Variovorax sp. SG517]
MKIDHRCTRQTEAELKRRELALQEAFTQRGRSVSAWTAWKVAAERFRSYESPVFELWSDEAREGVLQGKGAWRESAILYIEMGPRFFRSGYLRDRLCHLLKQSDLSEQERSSVLRSLLTSLTRRPSTGRFCHDCRLAVRWADDEFAARVREISTRKDRWTGGRARRMLHAIEQDKIKRG